jgi:23S rRNA (guanine2445-N2)-methyltransferase / 23S rRNA (guanine2069-N7)-methyltransferase
MSSDSTLELFSALPKGLEPLHAQELREFGGSNIREIPSGVHFSATLETAYRACLWSRVASRIYLPIATLPARTTDELYSGCRSLSWEDHLQTEGSFAVSCTVASSEITHSKFAALRVKDAIVDRFRDRTGKRPSVETDRPNLPLHAHIHRDIAIISIDLSGESLHRRGYRLDGVAAPLKENLAAGILLYSKWPAIAGAGGSLVDLMCGSGTFAIEAAMIAGGIAPGTLRDYYGFIGWMGHNAELWSRLLEEARKSMQNGLTSIPPIFGYDTDPVAIQASLANAERAGFKGKINFEERDFSLIDLSSMEITPGLVIANPPYGERLGEIDEAREIHSAIGLKLRESFQNWDAAILTGNPDMGRELRIRPRKVRTLYNGAIECRLLHFDVKPSTFFREERGLPDLPPEPGEEMFANRIRKDLRMFGKWARKNGIECYRLYDADMPQYAVAIDLYGSYAHVQEYEAPKSIDPKRARHRLNEALSVLPGLLEIPRENIFLKVRKKQRGASQYQSFDSTGEFRVVHEGGLKFLVNFEDYLDTGLFLDHRITRGLIRELASGRRFLNLFAYTGSASVYAAAGGAIRTTTVDMSATYIRWAERNMTLNGFTGLSHELVQEDCFEYLESERKKYDLIFLDPPTFSNSRRMERSFDVQRDHVELIKLTGNLLSKGGVMIFSTNLRTFGLNRESLPEYRIEDITRNTISKDFERNPRIHSCFKISWA